MGTDQIVPVILAVLGGAAVAGAAFFFVGRNFERRIAEMAGRSAEQRVNQMLQQGQREAEAAKAQAILAGQEEVMKRRQEWDREEKEQRSDIDRQQKRLVERENLIDRKLNTLDDR